VSTVAQRKWLIRRQRDERGQVRGHHGWIVTAPSGARRWFFTWSSLEALCPFFVMGEQCAPLREMAPEIYDGGVRI
jgi:hypothetical protein